MDLFVIWSGLSWHRVLVFNRITFHAGIVKVLKRRRKVVVLDTERIKRKNHCQLKSNDSMKKNSLFTLISILKAQNTKYYL